MEKGHVVFAEELGAVVVIVSVIGTAVVEEVKVTDAGLKLQVLFGGKFEHMVGERSVEPVKPFAAVKVSVANPDCPGLIMLIADGLAVMTNVSPTSTKIAEEVEAPKLESPLYRTVMLFVPCGRVALKLAPGGLTLESTATGEPRGVPLE
jgi:hypothetical protein